MAVAIGPSGNNDDYLFNLDEFLSESKFLGDEAQSVPVDENTRYLSSLARQYQKTNLYFMFGAGSNQHNQLLLRDATQKTLNAASLINGDEAHELKEIVLSVMHESKACVHERQPPKPKELYAGGGHSGMLTEDGELFLWGWNEDGQLGRGDANVNEGVQTTSAVEFKVHKAALGHSHTVLIRKDDRQLVAYGDNDKGQTNAPRDQSRYVDVGAGVFHSAAITEEGELVTFGETKYGACLLIDGVKQRWRPEDGSRLVKVACGRRHTVILDEHGRIWTLGSDNKYGQLGRALTAEVGSGNFTPQLVDGFLGKKNSGCCSIDCGWSHTVVLVEDGTAYGWGRNHLGQLGLVCDDKIVPNPRKLSFGDKEASNRIKTIVCGSEFTIVIDNENEIFSCGWNEHGNSGTAQNDEMIPSFSSVRGASVTTPPTLKDLSGEKLIAAGGAHFIVVGI